VVILEVVRKIIENEGRLLTTACKVKIVNTVGSLSLNVNSLVQSTSAWLRLCLTVLQKAAGRTEYRHLDSHSQIEGVEKDELLAALDSAVTRKTT